MDEQGQDIFEFGMSVSVNDDLRRNIEKDTEKLKQVIHTSKKEIVEEENKSQKLKMEKTDAENETKQLYVRSKDLRDTMATVTEVFRGEYANKFQRELAIPTKVVTPLQINNGTTESEATRGKENNDDDAVTTALVVGGNNQGRSFHLRGGETDNAMTKALETHNEFHEKFRNLPTRIKTLQDAFRAAVSRSKDKVAEEKKATEQVHHLKAELANFQKETQSLKTTYEMNDTKHQALTKQLPQLKSSIQSLKESIQQKVCDILRREKKPLYSPRTEAFSLYLFFTHSDNPLKRKLDDDEATYYHKKVKLDHHVAKLVKLEQDHVATLQVQKWKLTLANKRSAQLEADYTTYMEWKNTFDEQKNKHEDTLKDNDTLLAQQKNVEAELSSAVNRRNTLHSDIARLKQQIDEQNQEIATVQTKVATLVSEIDDDHKQLDELEQKRTEYDDPTKAFAVATDAEFEVGRLENELATAKDQLDDSKKVVKDIQQEQFEQDQKYKVDYDELVAKKQGLESKIADRRAEMKARGEARAQTSNEIKRRYEVLQFGAKLISTAKKKEASFMSKESLKMDESS